MALRYIGSKPPSRFFRERPLKSDAVLVWLAGRFGCRAILTVDLRDFGVYRLKRGKRFEVVKWFA